jgi:hypothetical protein
LNVHNHAPGVMQSLGAHYVLNQLFIWSHTSW